VRRREFITLLVGTAAWPLAARAQHHDRVRRIGVLMAVAENDPESQFRVNALEAGLRELGWMEGRNLRIEYRWAPAYRGPRHLPEKAKGGAVDVAPACNNYGASMPCTRPLKVCRAGPRVRTSGEFLPAHVSLAGSSSWAKSGVPPTPPAQWSTRDPKSKCVAGEAGPC
jgi:hypothetical protein